MKLWFTFTKVTTLVILVVELAKAQDPKNFEHLSRCIKIAEPLVRDPKYIFPLNVQDIRDVCRMWEEFIECVYDYANTYMAPMQQQDFNKTIQSNIEVIQQLCVEDPDYHKLYMAYAPCMKRVSIGASHCGKQYTYLTDLVARRSVSDGQLCCAHRMFRECVLDKTAVECDGGGMLLGGGNSPSQFMREMLDQTMGFLLQKCKEFVPNSRDCPGNIFSVAAAGNPGFSNTDDTDALINNNNSPPPDPPTAKDSTSPPPKPPPPPPSSSATTPATTRFTWTTRNPAGAKPVTTKPTTSVNLAGTGLLGPASQQFKDSGVSTTPALAAVFLGLLFVLNL